MITFINKLLFVICILALFFSAKSQTLKYQNDSNLQSLGIGLLQKNKINDIITFYLDSNFQKKYGDQNLIGTNLTPLLYKPDYGICFFICSKSTNKYFIVKSNNGKDLYIKNSDPLTFFSWQTFLCNEVIGVANKDSLKNPPQYNINGKIINTKNWSINDEQHIIEVKDEWIKIINETRKIKYWIKWKQESNLLIYLNLLP